jgi:hypothetical protein
VFFIGVTKTAFNRVVHSRESGAKLYRKEKGDFTSPLLLISFLAFIRADER